MDMQELGYFLFMEEQEKKYKEQQQEKVNVDPNDDYSRDQTTPNANGV